MQQWADANSRRARPLMIMVPSVGSRSFSGSSVVVAFALLLAVGGGVVIAGTAQGAQPPTSMPSTPPAAGALPDGEVLQGERAVEVLEATDTVAAVAATAAMTEDDLLDSLETDPTMFVSPTGLVGYAEPPVPADEEPADALTTAYTVPPGVDVFALNSRPGTGRVVFLDFTGHTTTGTFWNQDFGVEPIVSTPYDTDGNPSTFSTWEREQIYATWQLVADDYAPFDVNVTTIDPGVEGLRKTSTNDTSFGTRVVITSSDWFFDAEGFTIGGIAYVNVFSTSWGLPAFVFAGNLGDGRAKFIGEAASHEAGHTFGLGHDGTSSSEYYSGHGDWAPIMGSGYNRTITQWSRGEYTGANNAETDLSVIAGHAPVVTDDHGNVAGAATPVAATSTTPGLITGGDVDVFAVTVGAGSLSATVAPTGKNLHASITIRDSGGNVVASASPATALGFNATAAATVPAGSYTIHVTPVGWLTATTGFTSYASLGAYAMTISGAATSSTTSTTSPTTTSTTSPTTSTTSPTTSTTSPTTSTTSPTTSTTSTTVPPTVPPPVPADPTAGFVAMTPERIVDTRLGLGGSARLGAGRLVAVSVAGRPGISPTATAAVINVTAVAPSGNGYLSVFPCEGGSPDTSVLNYALGEVVANTTIATLDETGRFCVWTLAPADVLIDITGWLAPSIGSRLAAIDPVRVADTRSGLGGSRRLAPGDTLELDLGDRVDPSATAVALNVTAVGAATGGFLTAYPCGENLPTTSTVNHGPGEVRPNNTIVGLADGRVCIFSLAETDVLVDLVGHFGPIGLGYVPAAPERLVDTRDAGAPLPRGGVVPYDLGVSPHGPPSAASVNITAVGHTLPGFATTYACGSLPGTSTLNVVAGQIAANGAIVPATSAATSCAFTLNGGHLLVDLAGWWV